MFNAAADANSDAEVTLSAKTVAAAQSLIAT